MSEPTGDKTEEATPKRIEEASREGNIARSPEIQTVFVMGGCLLALTVFGSQIWFNFVNTATSVLGHLHEYSISQDEIPAQFVSAVLLIAGCTAPVAVAAMLSALVAGGAQTQFQTAPDALKTKWTKLNPVTGLKRIFSWKQLIPAGLSILKLVVIGRLLYGTVSGIASDPIFYSIVDAARIAEYLASSTYSITARVLAVMFVIAGLDYTYQRWRTGEDLKMTKQEVKDEMKNSEGDPLVKQQRNRMAGRASKRKMLENVPEADVIITNPTHFAVALKYDVDAMQAPRVVAKGTRLFALKIKALAKENGVPIREDKPLARFMYKHCEVDGQIPAELFATVAKILAIVYRENRYRYFRKKAE